MTRLPIAAAGVAAILALAACGSSSGGTGGNQTVPTSQVPPPASQGGGPPASSRPPATSGPTITIKDFGYSGDLTVKAGAKVTVVNEDSTQHSLTDTDTHKFDTGAIAPNGGTATFTAPTQPGSYSFGCMFHPEMSGTLQVTS
jgi:plastocyanin